MKNFLRLAAALLLVALFGRVDVSAQVVTTQPEVITQDTKNVVITFHADWGNRGMVGLSSSAAVYAHTGVITDKSKSNQDWLYCTSNWNTPQAKFKMTYAGPNLWTLTIPDIREWYGVPEGETIEKLTFVFHATSGTKPEGKTLMGGDIYLTLFPENFPQPKEEAYPGGTPKLGVTPNADGSATFCFVAPDKKSVVLRGSWNDYALVGSQQMNYTDFGGNRYFWCTVPGVANGQNQTYYYLVDGQIEVGDPYAHLVLDYENDKTIPASVFPDMPAYPARLVATPTIPLAVFNSTESDYAWEVADFQGPDRSDLVIYELLVRDFTGTENAARGDGTIEKAIEKLDYLKALGVNAVELLPIMEFSGNQSWGYNPNFYLAPDKAYGTPDAYRRFIDECHKRGMAVILDIVFNHVDGRHPWYNMYPGISTKFFNAAGSAPHAYSVFNDWKQEYELVEQHFEDALKYWITEFKADGFRFDLVKGLGYNDSYNNPTYNAATNQWGNPSNLEALTGAFNASRVARMKALHDAVRTVKPDAYMINENLAGVEEENDMARDQELNWANVNYASCQFAMGFESGAGLSRFYAPSDGGRLWGSTVSYAESHDEERMAYKVKTYGATGVKGNAPMMMRRLGSVAAQMLLTPGSHMIWQFQELGADQTTKNSTGGNDTGNKRVVWSLLNNANNKSLHESYRQLIHLRTLNPTLFAESAEATVSLDAWSGGRTLTLTDGSRELLLVVNPNVSGTADIYIPATVNPRNMVVLDQSPLLSGESQPTISGAYIKGVPAGAYLVYASENTLGVDGVLSDSNPDGCGFTMKVVGSDLHVYAPDGSELSPAEYQVYTVSGARVASTSLHSGVYLVSALGSTRKLAL